MVPEDTKFALVHLDCDLYTPTKAAMEFFYPRLMPAVTQAANEYLADKPEGLIRVPDKSGTAAPMKHRDTAGPRVAPAGERDSASAQGRPLGLRGGRRARILRDGIQACAPLIVDVLNHMLFKQSREV